MMEVTNRKTQFYLETSILEYVDLVIHIHIHMSFLYGSWMLIEM